MKVVHVIPVPCIFEHTIQRRANTAGHACFRYSIARSFKRNLLDLWRIFKYYRSNPDALYLFHQVPHFRLGLLSLLLPRFRYGLHYWGGDFYSAFLDETDFEQHCIRKSPLLQARYYVPKLYSRSWSHRFYRHAFIWWRRWFRWPRRMMGFRVLSHATAILSLCPKQFRIARLFYLRALGMPLITPQYPTRVYEPDARTLAPSVVITRPGELRILICHSATPTVAPHQSLDILRRYKQRWDVKLHVRGFLSYSGGGEAYRDALEQDLTQAAQFCDSVKYERKFLDTREVEATLNEIDIAVFSCLRDEGVGLLTQFVNLGGLVSFNRFSFNYDVFRNYSRSKLLTHEQFLDLSPNEILRQRLLEPDPPPTVIGYEQFDKLLPRLGARATKSSG